MGFMEEVKLRLAWERLRLKRLARHIGYGIRLWWLRTKLYRKVVEPIIESFRRWRWKRIVRESNRHVLWRERLTEEVKALAQKLQGAEFESLELWGTTKLYEPPFQFKPLNVKLSNKAKITGVFETENRLVLEVRSPKIVFLAFFRKA
jgi:hypothetical protein